MSNNLVQLPYEAQLLAFQWHQNIGDPLSHLAHFGSFLSESQRQGAIEIIQSYSRHQEMFPLIDLMHYVNLASINENKPTIVKVTIK